MIKEAYCSFEVSKLLKEKGFVAQEIYYIYYYYEEDDGYCFEKLLNGNKFDSKKMVAVPSHQMAMAWLREEKNLIITIDYDRYPVISDENKYKTRIGYGYNIQTKGNPEDYYGMHSEYVYNSYEEAIEAALKFCLTKLI